MRFDTATPILRSARYAIAAVTVLPAAACGPPASSPSVAGDVPIGAVIDWWRPDEAWPIPDGFVVADGQVVGDPDSPLDGATLPDLRGRFVRGVGDPVDIGISGGATTHFHSATPPTASATTVEVSHRHRWARQNSERQWIGWLNSLSMETSLLTNWPALGVIPFPADRAGGMFPLAGSAASTVRDYYTSTETVPAMEVQIDLPPFETDTAPNEPPYFGLLKIVRVR